MKFEFSQHIFEKSSNIKFHKHPFSGNRVVPCRRTNRQTDKYDETNSRFSQFCGRSWKQYSFWDFGTLFWYWCKYFFSSEENLECSMLLIKHRAMKMQFHTFLASELVEIRRLDWISDRPHYPAETANHTHWTGSWVRSRNCLDSCRREKNLSSPGNRTTILLSASL